MDLKVGTVFRWIDFPDNRYDDVVKPRWFICVGFTGTLDPRPLVYSYTTTTQLQHFDPGGSREGHAYFVFKTCEFPCFDQDCAIDFNESPYPIEKNKLAMNSTKIEEKGTLNEQTMRMIYKRTEFSRHVSYVVKMDIFTSYNQAGITGLMKPRKNTKRK